MVRRRLSLDRICLDFQPASSLIDDVVAGYQQRMRRREKIDAVLICYDGKKYWLKDGFHRVRAARNLGRKTISTEIIRGTLAEMEAEWREYLRVLKQEIRGSKATEKPAGAELGGHPKVDL